MNKKNQKGSFVNMKRIGNYTKNAVEKFEENIVTQEDYLEKIKDDEKTEIPGIHWWIIYGW